MTQDELKSLLKYDPETGIFKWLVNRSNVSCGDVAGTITPKGYITIGVNGSGRQAHRLAWLYMTGKWPEQQIDHINGIKGDNRFCNLRDVSPSGNSKNQRLCKNNKTGITGVFWLTNASKWCAEIKVNYERKYLSLTGDFFEACCARKSAENKYGFHPNHGSRK